MIRAAGGVVWRAGSHGPVLALVHRPRNGEWRLPKGNVAWLPPAAAARLVDRERERRVIALARDAGHRVPRVSGWAG